jgi:putative transposase
MEESQVALEADLQEFDEVLLSDRAFDTDPSKILIESSDPQKLRFRMIEWLAEAPNRKVKAERKKKIAETLDVSTRQVERLLDRYNDELLHETVGIDRSDKGQHRIGDYWPEYVRSVYEQSVKDKHPLTPANIVREVHRHALIDLRHEQGDYPHKATIYRILKPLVERQKRRTRNPGSGSWMSVETKDGKLLKADFSNQIVQCDHTKLDVRIVDEDGNLLNWRPWLTTVVDTFSSCLIGYHLWHKQPGSHEVALTLRHAALPKNYPPEYELQKSWDICGLPLHYFFTDGGRDLAKSKLIKAFGKKFGFQCELRDRPIQGGIVERLFGTINTQVLQPLAGYISPEDGGAERAEKEACLTIEDVDKILAAYFCDDYNHQPYPKDPRDTRYERWLRGMGGKLPEQLNERELDILLMKEEQRVVQDHGSIFFETLTYRCEELKPFKGQYVTVNYDPDHVLTLYAYTQATGDRSGKFIGCAHAINMDIQDSSLYELKQLNKERNTTKREHSNYSAAIALDKRQKLVTERKQSKKERQQIGQKELRGKSKQNSKVVEMRKVRAGKSVRNNEPMELLPERVSSEQIKPQTPKSLPPASTPESNPTIHQLAREEATPTTERNRIIIAKNQTLKRIW